jgi:uncharacterized protein YqgV (UPF0045/DUF77 family)
MICSLEISMYPLKDQYKPSIVKFVQNLRTYDDINVKTNGMSTQIFGEYQKIMNAINIEIESSFKQNKSIVFNMKLINSELEETPQL